ncbi:MAG: glycosyl transferase [Clostridia bacterium]|nr:glycosyl transferase [Clostridia bacterium]
MKVLVLSCNTGQGHNTAASALVREFTSLGIYCEMADALAFDSKLVSRFVCGIYAKAAVHAPGIYSFAYNTAELIAEYSPDRRSICYLTNMKYSGKLYRYIRDNGYDVVVASHVFPAASVTRILRKNPGAFASYYIATDYTYHLFLKDTCVDGYFIPHKSLTHCFTDRGLPADRIFSTGIPVDPSFSQHRDKAEARRLLGFDEDARILLVMSGSMGFGPVEELVAALAARRGLNDEIVVMGGNNEKLKASLRFSYALDPAVRVLDYTTLVSLYMDAADLLFTKPGGLSTTEAAVKGIPLILTKAMPGWEVENVSFFVNHGMARTADGARALADAAFALLDDPDACADMVEAQRAYTNAHAARDMCEHIIAKHGSAMLGE